MSQSAPAWEERLADVRGVHSIHAEQAGVGKYPALFSPRKVGRLLSPNSIK